MDNKPKTSEKPVFLMASFESCTKQQCKVYSEVFVWSCWQVVRTHPVSLKDPKILPTARIQSPDTPLSYDSHKLGIIVWHFFLTEIDSWIMLPRHYSFLMSQKSSCFAAAWDLAPCPHFHYLPNDLLHHQAGDRKGKVSNLR